MSDLRTSSLQLFVDRLASRSVLTEQEVNALLSLKGHSKELAAHSDFVQLGDEVDHSSLIMQGLVGRFGQNAEGARQITSFYIPGDMADLASVVSPTAGWGFGALTRTMVLRVPHADLKRVATQHTGIAEAFWRDCVADGSIFSEWVVNIGRRTAISRLAHILCEMATRYEQAGQGNSRSFPLPVTQSDLADATGMTSIHVNRTLKELKTRAIVEMRSGIVTVHDWDGLVAVGDFDAAFMLLAGPWPRFPLAA